LILVVLGQGYKKEFVQTVQPNITASLPIGPNLNLSFPEGAVGAWSALYNDTDLRLGMINNTFGEFIFKSSSSCVDVSREPNITATT
jgi:hypothetical protein